MNFDWLYGSGFPKSLNLRGEKEGWGTALKPGREPIILARKPLEGTVAENVLKHGTGALNIEGCRIATNGELEWSALTRKTAASGTAASGTTAPNDGAGEYVQPIGRWPANVILTHSGACEFIGTRKVKASPPVTGSEPSSKTDAVFGTFARRAPSSQYGVDGYEEMEAWNCAADCPIRQLNEQSGITTSGAMKREVNGYDGTSVTGFLHGRSGPSNQHGDRGGASRFFYVVKTSPKERNAGCENLPDGNNHPTVKPIALMRYLCRLITPPDGTVLDPFAGSGSTGCAAVLEGFRFIGIELLDKHANIARARIDYWQTQKPDMSKKTFKHEPTETVEHSLPI